MSGEEIKLILTEPNQLRFIWIDPERGRQVDSLGAAHVRLDDCCGDDAVKRVYGLLQALLSERDSLRAARQADEARIAAVVKLCKRPPKRNVTPVIGVDVVLSALAAER